MFQCIIYHKLLLQLFEQGFQLTLMMIVGTANGCLFILHLYQEEISDIIYSSSLRKAIGSFKNQEISFLENHYQGSMMPGGGTKPFLNMESLT